MRFFYKVVLVVALCIKFAQSTFYSKEDKICDPLARGLTKFTGFKIHRQYVVKDLKPPMLHLVSMSHCQDGEMNFERLMRTGRETDIEWDKPFCLIEPEVMKGMASKYVVKRGKLPVRFPSFSDIPKAPHSVLPNIESHIKRSFRDKFNHFLRKISSHLNFIEYIEDPLETDLENLKTLSYENISSVRDLEDSLTCYKLARRKKYALRQLMVYAPSTFVGGVFQCNISDGDKTRYIESLQDTRDFIKPYEFLCNSEDAIPLSPLLADNLNQQWIERSKGLTISQRVPYLYSPGPLDMRFGKSAKLLGMKPSTVLKKYVNNDSSDKLPVETWFKEIEVNERYNFTESDMGIITESITATVNQMKEFLKINPKYLPWEWDKEELTGNKEAVTYLEHKLLTIISKFSASTAVESFTNLIQKNWDSIILSPESFSYNAQ